MPQQIPQTRSMHRLIQTRPLAKVSQLELESYWTARRFVSRFEQRVLASNAISVEPGELTLPALRATKEAA